MVSPETDFGSASRPTAFRVDELTIRTAERDEEIANAIA
jgi:hypothetical protein